jgi:hypothetical protein
LQYTQGHGIVFSTGKVAAVLNGAHVVERYWVNGGVAP